MLATEGYIVTGASDGLLRLWPLDFSDYLMQAQHDSPVAVAVSDDDLKRREHGGRHPRHPERGEPRVLDGVRSHKTGVSMAEAAIDQFATAGKDGTIRVWELESGRQRYEFTAGGRPTALDYHLQEQIIACGFASGAVRILGVADTSTMHEPAHKVRCTVPRGDGSFSTRRPRAVPLRLRRRERLPAHASSRRRVSLARSTRCVSARPDGRFVVATSADGPRDARCLSPTSKSVCASTRQARAAPAGHVKYCSVSVDSTASSC